MLSVLHLIVYAAGILLTSRRTITVFHIALVHQIFAFGVRPLLVVWVGGHTLYTSALGWEGYFRGMSAQLAFISLYVTTYVYLDRTCAIRIAGGLKSKFSGRALLWALALGVGSVGLMVILTGTMWLPTERNQTVTSVVPYGKIIFPLAVINLAAVIPLALIWWTNNRSQRVFIAALFCVVVAVILIALLYQRGFLLVSVIAALFVIETIRRRLKWRYVILAGAGLLLVLMLLRPAVHIALGVSEEQSVDVSSSVAAEIIDGVLRKGTFDNADVWSIVMEFSETQGFQMGRTYLAVPMRFATPSVRERAGIFTAVDMVNEYYAGSGQYWTKTFGFNVTFAQEAFLNFGWFFLVLAIPLGIGVFLVDRAILKLDRGSAFTVYAVLAAFFSSGFLMDMAAMLQWCSAFLFFGVLVNLFSRIGWHGFKRQGAAIWQRDSGRSRRVLM